MKDSQVAEFFEGMRPWERAIVASFPEGASDGYSGIAKKCDLSYDAVKYACERLKANRFARMDYLRDFDGKFGGSRIFLTDLGKKLRQKALEEQGLSNT